MRSLLASLDAGADEAIGLLLTPELHSSSYEETPAGALVFAVTGGDGVHFSLLASNASAPLDWPVVMTVPMALDCPNHIVGANLLDFLAIGLRSGYFILEQLPYDPDWALAAMLDPEEHFERPALMTHTLLAIRDHFALAAWDKHRQRLEELKSTFGLN